MLRLPWLNPLGLKGLWPNNPSSRKRIRQTFVTRRYALAATSSSDDQRRKSLYNPAREFRNRGTLEESRFKRDHREPHNPYVTRINVFLARNLVRACTFLAGYMERSSGKLASAKIQRAEMCAGCDVRGSTLPPLNQEDPLRARGVSAASHLQATVCRVGEDANPTR